MSIAERIASMKLEQMPGAGASNSRPALAPRRSSVRSTPNSEVAPQGGTNFSSLDPDLLRALRRKPPPPPKKKVLQAYPESSEDGVESEATPPPPPARRLPPMPTRLPTPPPEPEPEIQERAADEEEESSCLMCHDFSHVDEHAAMFPRENVQSLDHLAYDLTSPWGSETEKFRAIFSWMHHNIAYDTQAFFSGNLRPATAESTLQSGLAVCDGYAGLFVTLSHKAGLQQAYRVTGHGKGLGYTAAGRDAVVPPFEGNHAWNAAVMDGEWHLIDPCWGAGAVDGTSYNPRFAPMWLTSDHVQFGKRHFPEDASYQLLEQPMSWEEYILVPEGPVLFGDFYQMSFAPDSVLPVEKEVQAGSWIHFRVDKLCEHMSRGEEDNYVYFISTPDDNRTALTVDEYGGWSADVYVPQGRGEISLYYVTMFDNQDGKGLAVSAFQNGIGRKAMAFGGLARWTAVV